MRKRSDLILWWGIGNTANESQRHVNYKVNETGWLDFKARKLDPAIEWARDGKFKPRVQLHWPFGSDHDRDGNHWDFDAWVEAEDGGFNNLVDEYVEMGRQLNEEGVKLITYFQSLRLDLDMRELLLPGSDGSGYLDRFWRSVKASISVGSVGFDNIVSIHVPNKDYTIKPGHPGYDLTCAIRNMYAMTDRDEAVIIEAIPQNEAWWWFDWPMLIRNDLFHSRHVDLTTNKGRFARFEKGKFNIYSKRTGKLKQRNVFREEIIRLVVVDTDSATGVRDSKDGVVETYRQIRRDGHTMAFKPDWAMANGITAKDVRGA